MLSAANPAWLLLAEEILTKSLASSGFIDKILWVMSKTPSCKNWVNSVWVGELLPSIDSPVNPSTCASNVAI